MFSFSAAPVLELVRAAVKAGLTAQGEAPNQLPLATTAEQTAFHVGDEGDETLPLTVIRAKGLQPEDLGTSQMLTLSLCIDHVRALEAGTGVGVETALSRLAALAAAFKSDYRLHATTTAGGLTGADIPIHQVLPGRLSFGDDNDVQAALIAKSQDVSLVAGSLDLEIQWYEGL